jgi:poly-gamma-glutamate synthesis protein (capsule biosynthesis protein)
MLFFMLLGALVHCEEKKQPPTASAPSVTTLPAASLSASASAIAAVAQPPRPVVLVAGGDIDLSRNTGQRILKNPELNPFSNLQSWLRAADIRFANLESPLCDLGGKTVSEHNRLIFAGPPSGADVLARGHFDIVSTANNHIWDFGKRCLEETLFHVKRVGIQAVGTDAQGKDPLRPVILERNGQHFAFFAVTGIFNHGRLRDHVAKPYIADADMGALSQRITEVKPKVDWVIVSVHIGEEYIHIPIEATRYALIGAAQAGADLVLGHHSHTPQRVEFHKQIPVVMSLGNFVFHQHRDHPWTGWSYLARVTFPPKGPLTIEACPFFIFDASPQPLTQAQQTAYFQHWDAISRAPRAAIRGARSADGCVALLSP